MPVLHCLLNTTLAAGIPSHPLNEVKEVIVRGWRVEEAGRMRKKEWKHTTMGKRSESGVAVSRGVYKGSE